MGFRPSFKPHELTLRGNTKLTTYEIPGGGIGYSPDADQRGYRPQSYRSRSQRRA
jgi:hypothetical protein